ncbi:MAG: glycolate oxidase subunit GlcE [Candidimonas sp.]|nr:MAG: glycolate oxidase subunit GlcE [Candidimonas sp.]
MDFELSELVERVMTARAGKRALYVRGGGTKDFYGEPDGLRGANHCAVLDVSAYHGVVNYQPSELVVTARGGTLLADIERLLDEHGQMLAFEPPRFGASSTLGGCVAAGLSGPRRAAAGRLRDFVLGAKLLDSSGAVLGFGGEVMKNVAGYDVSRLLAGSLGIFGVLVEVSLKVVPKPLVEKTLALEVDEAGALALFNQWRGKPLPVSATVWMAREGRGVLWVRLSGSAPAVRSGIEAIGGELLEPADADRHWASVRDQTHPFFRARPLWRLALPPQTGPVGLGPTLIEWNGGQRWLVQPPPAHDLRARAVQLGGHATRFRGDADGVPVFQPLPVPLMNISRRLKHALDPVGIFNPKRLFPEF